MLEGRAIHIGIDGNCGYALCGDNLQTGQAEFVEIADVKDTESQRAAAIEAFNKLRTRLEREDQTWVEDESLPKHKHKWVAPDMHWAECVRCGETIEG
jgi:hypothetical protein